MTTVRIWTDGSCLGNPGPGGYAIVLHAVNEETGKENYREVVSEPQAHLRTTNNKMELEAVICALETVHVANVVKNQIPVIIFSDSDYVVSGFNTHMQTWENNGWRNSRNKPIANKEIWQRARQEIGKFNWDRKLVKFERVAGHAGNYGNERCHELAINQAHRAKQLITQKKGL